MSVQAIELPETSTRRLIFTFVFVLLSLCGLALFNRLLSWGDRHLNPVNGFYAFLPFFGAVLFSLALAGRRYDVFAPVLRAAIRASALGLLIYLVIEPASYTLARPEGASQNQYLTFLYYPALILSVGSIFRPALVLPVAVYILTTRSLIDVVAGLPASTLDIRYMVDMAIYLTAAGLGITALARRGLLDSHTGQRLQLLALFVGFGLHLGNYFWSGVAKMAVGQYPWSWIVENKTQNLIPFALQKGAMPLAQWPWLVQSLYDAMSVIIQPVNFAIVAFQLFAVVCALRLDWLKVATLFYDVMHIGIYVAGGVLFWPWIWNNFTILLATRKLTTPMLGTAPLACVLTVLLSYPHLGLYKAAWLGWFDVADARQVYFEAITNSGAAVRVPPSFFLSHSFTVSLGYMDQVRHQGHFDPTNWNSARDYARQLTSGSCPKVATIDAPLVESPEKHAKRLAIWTNFMRAHHAKMLMREEVYGHNSFYWRMHHHPSNPFLYAEFNALNLRDVRGYNLVVESTCHSIRDGKSTHRVVARTADYIGLQ